MSSSQPVPSSEVPYRQIRAVYDDDTITVYQAYSASIALDAVKEQKLNACRDFGCDRTTWIKPSWCWMMYRSGYGTKDERQTHILALKMRHEAFQQLLAGASVCTSTSRLSAEDKARPVRVQWDPERSPKLGLLPYRSIQIGIRQQLVEAWVKDGIVEIEDVTERAAGLKEAVARGAEWAELREKGFMPEERVYEVPEELRKVLRMDVQG